MLSIQQLQSLVASEISAMPIKATPADLYNPIKYALSLNAKRVRPAMVLLSCQAFGGNIADALKPAIGIELFHNFTLLHDDIMDNAPLRRKEPTVHTKWNNNVAILSGDAMFAKSFQYILMAPDFATQAVGNIFAETALSVCEGQQYDMDYEKAGTIKIDDYIQMISLKTAVLLAASLKIGAILAHASDNNSNHIFEFGRNMGIAFQLQDDILDVYADPEKFGKQIGGDIIANKKTYLLISALYHANIDQYEQLTQLISDVKNRYEPYEKIARVTSIYNALGVKEMAQEAVDKYYQIALSHLEKITLDDCKKQMFYDFSNSLKQRDL